MTKLNLGCGIAPLRGFVNVDACFTPEEIITQAERIKGEHENVDPHARFVRADVRRLPFPERYADYVVLDNVIEHLPMVDVIPALREIHRVMKPEAEFVVLTPDFNCLAKLWADNISAYEGKLKDFNFFIYLAQTIYGNQAGPGEFHCTPMNPDFLRLVLQEAGFVDIVVEKYPMFGPGPEFDGLAPKKGSVMRTDNLLARCKAAPAPLGVSAGENLKVLARMV